MRGQYVLIDFWGSWCTPCRKEAPLVKQFYQDWKDVAFKDGNGLEILSIAIEGNRRDWDLAVKEEKMDWPLHILELDQFHSPLVKSFGVREIPTKILLDAQHHIVAVNQSFPEMAELLTRKKI